MNSQLFYLLLKQHVGCNCKVSILEAKQISIPHYTVKLTVEAFSVQKIIKQPVVTLSQVVPQGIDICAYFRFPNGLSEMFDIERFVQGQLLITWLEDNVVQAQEVNTLYCTCGGPTRTDSYGRKSWKVCTQCKKEQK